MANLPFKINIETTAGREVSYFTSSLAESTENNITAVTLVDRINTMNSSSYTSSAQAPSSFITSRNFGTAANIWLSASVDGDGDAGAVVFTHTDSDDTAQRLKKYRFFGTKVCNVLGFPEGQWIYPQNFILDDTPGGDNYFSGDVAATNLNLTRGFTMANTATVRSNLRFATTSGSGADLFVQFTTGSGAFQTNALLLGYDTDTNRYVLNGGGASGVDKLYIDAGNGDLQSLTATHTRVTSSRYKVYNEIHGNASPGSEGVIPQRINLNSTQGLIQLISQYNSNVTMIMNSFSDPGSIVLNYAGVNCDIQIRGDNENNLLFTDASTDRVGIGTNAPTSRLHIKETSNDENAITFEDDSNIGYIGMANDSDFIHIGEGSDVTANQKLTVDLANTRVGINNATPSYPLDVNGNGRVDSLYVQDSIVHDGDTNTGIAFTGDQIDFVCGGITMLTLDESTNDKIVFNEGGGNVDFRVESDTIQNMIDMDAGKNTVAIGADATDTYGSSLEVYGHGNNWATLIETDNEHGDHILIRNTVVANPPTTAHVIQAIGSGNGVYYEVQGDGSGGSQVNTSFTSGHDTCCVDDDAIIPGLLVETTGEMWAKSTSSFQIALPFTKLCQSNGSKNVFGVIDGELAAPWITGSTNPQSSSYIPYVKGDYLLKPSFMGYAQFFPTGSGNRHLHTNSIGEGSMWVTNHNGEIENGDYIESSVIKGYGRKQNDDIMRSKTVAKCLENIDWSNVSDTITYSGSAYKKYLTAVTFHCG